MHRTFFIIIYLFIYLIFLHSISVPVCTVGGSILRAQHQYCADTVGTAHRWVDHPISGKCIDTTAKVFLLPCYCQHRMVF